MDWLKTAIGEENYNSLGDETLSKLKGFLKDKKFIEDDKGKFIEKHVFNTQREELKEAKKVIDDYKKELEKRSDLITADEHKLKLLESQKDFERQLKENNENYEKQLNDSNKINSLTNLFTSNGATNPEFMINNVKLDDVILKDGKIQNGNDILENMKKNVPGLFNNLEANVPNNGGGGSPTTKENLIKDYEKNMNAGNVAGAMSIQRQIKELENDK